MSDEQIDEYGRLIYCAHCGEKSRFTDNKEAEYCMHCGYSLINRCTNYNDCGKFLPPDAAFCPFCGSESHFLRSKLIESKRQYIVNDDDLPF